ncbi:universal stress protein [Tundrisphaera lichenicola]|uniref:universal stress protein n=1 Tax=Tundrisphaera lichenicola TaxID=2029860 RepID=UPI003EBA2696
MLRTILVGLDGTVHGDSALKLAIRWSKRYDALLVGLGCVDEPGIHGPEEIISGEGYFSRLNSALLEETRTRVEATLSQAALRCAEAGVAFKPLEDVGTPDTQILEEAQRFDLIMLGQQTHFRFGWENEPDVTLPKVLADTPRPVVVVPESAGEGDSVIVAYDGSLQAARALYAFEASGLGQGREIQVLSVSDEKKTALRHADRAIEFLKSHGMEANPSPVESGGSPGDVLLEMIRLSDPGLIVMGAYGQPGLREFFLGSTTSTLLKKGTIPMFLFH